jgi:hypothetical protein
MKKIIGLFTVFLIVTSMGSASGLMRDISQFSFPPQPSQVEDFDPLVDITVTVQILKIRSLEKRDIQVNAIEKIDWGSDPDFYVKIYINGDEFKSPVWYNQKYIENVGWEAKLNVPDDEEFVYIRIELWDWNLGLDMPCDVSNMNYNSEKYKDSFGVDLIYSIATGHWWGEDFAYYDIISADPSGYGRLNGCDDGSIYQRERDCELWFDITQTDYDNDGIPYWTEVNVYGTDPTVCDLGTDIDNDGVPIEWEHRWGHYVWYDWGDETYYHEWIYLPNEYNDHANLDPDEDGLSNYEEYLVSQWGSDPFRKDIFLEIDQMEKGPKGEGSYLPELSKELITTAFDRRNIVLHIDDGCMGGGQKNIPFDEETTDQELRTMYQNFFLNGNPNYWRKGIFHYALIIYHAERYPGFVFAGDNCLDSLQLSTKAHAKIAERYPILNRLVWRNLDMDEIYATVFAGALMHETGHTLGIFNQNTPGCDDQEGKFLYQINYWRWRPYKSVMNYGYVYKIVDYSDGSRGKNDFDDWDKIDLTYFQRSWH